MAATLNQDYRNAVLTLRPLAYWRLGEPSGTNAVDETLRLDGTYQNTPTLGVTGALTGDTDTAITLTAASSEAVNMGDVLNFERTDSFSLACWFKTSSATGQAIMGNTLGTGTAKPGYRAAIVGTGEVQFLLVNDGAGGNLINVTTTATTFADGNWHSLVATYDGSSNGSGVTIYIDGVAEALTVVTDALSASIANVADFSVGSRDSTDLFFDGSMDEAAVFGYELSAKDVAAMYYRGLDKSGYEYEVLALAPVGYWRLGEPSGTTASDELGNNDGTYTNTPTLGVAGALTNDVDTAITLASASSEYVVMTDVLDFENNVPFSLCGWFKTTTSGTQAIISKMEGTPNYRGYDLRIQASGAVGFSLQNTLATDRILVETTAQTFDDGNWHFAVATYDGSATAAGVVIYVDGVAGPMTTTGDDLTATTLTAVALQIGRRSDSTIYFDGSLDEAAIFATELTALEASRMYVAGLDKHGTDYAGEVLALAPVAYWRLGEASGTTAADELGVNDGTYNNTPTLGVTGALTDDTDTAITLASASSEDVSMGDVIEFEYNDPFSYAVWVKCTLTVNSTIMGKMLDTGATTGHELLMLSTGEVYVIIRYSNTGPDEQIQISTTAAGFDDGNWHFIVATYTGSGAASGVKIYVDGVEEALTTVVDTLSTTSILNAANFTIGSRNAASAYIDGTIDEATVFDYELTAANISRLYWRGKGYTQNALEVIGNSAAAYWRLGEGSGTNAADELGINDGTYVNTPTLGVTGALTNDADTAITCVAANTEEVTLGTTPTELAFDYDDPFSVSGWFKTSTAGNQAMISSEDPSAVYRGYQVSFGSSISFQLISTIVTNDIILSTVATGFDDGNWHHIACTYDGTQLASGMAIYVDGVPQAVTAIRDGLGPNTTVSTTPMHIGSRKATDLYADGSMDDISVHSIELTANQVADIYIGSLLEYASGALDGVVVESATLASLIGASADHSATETTDFVEILATFWGATVTESFNLEPGIGIITTLVELVNTSDSTDSARNQIGAVVESIQFALTQNIEHAKGVLEGLAMNEAWAANLIMQGDLTDTLNFAEVIQLTWDQLQSETVNVADVNSTYARRAAALAELFVSAGIVSTIHKAAGIIAEAIILQDLVERYFELSATDGITVTDAEATLYRAVAANIETAAYADTITDTRALRLLISDELGANDAATPAQRLRAALTDDAVFGGTVVLPDGVFSAIVLNTESLGISEYTNYPFNSFGKLGQTYLGASDTDIFQLNGDDDAGTDIDAVIRTGMTNFGTNVFKRVPRAYLGYTSDGGLIMKTISTSGGVKTERWYELTPRTGDHSSAAHAAARIKLGRGIKATYWQFELINKLGADFDIDSLQLYPMILSRRV